MEGFDGPTGFDEPSSEKVEEFRMGGWRPESPEVFGRLNETCTEVPSPDSVDDDASGKWVIGACDPFGEFEPSAAVGREDGSGTFGEHDFGESTFDDRSKISVASPDMDWDSIDDGFIGNSHDSCFIGSGAFEDSCFFGRFVDHGDGGRIERVFHFCGNGEESCWIGECVAGCFEHGIGQVFNIGVCCFGFLPLLVSLCKEISVVRSDCFAI